MNILSSTPRIGSLRSIQPQYWTLGRHDLWILLKNGRYPKLRWVSCRFPSSSNDGSSSSQSGETKKSSLDPSEDVFRLESDLQPRDLIFSSPKLRSWFGPNGQYVRELPCPSCRGRGYTPCTECGIDRSRLNCSQCSGKGLRTCQQCFGDRVIWEESIDERPWEKARSSSPFKVKEDDDVDKLVVEFKARKKRIYKSVPPEVCQKISSSLRSLNAKTGMFTKRMKDIHSDPILRAQRIAAIKDLSFTAEIVERRGIEDITARNWRQNPTRGGISAGFVEDEGITARHAVRLRERLKPRNGSQGSLGVGSAVKLVIILGRVLKLVNRKVFQGLASC